MTALPAWLTPESDIVAYFPRRDPALAEAWPVTKWSVRGAVDRHVTAQTEAGELCFRLPSLTMIGARSHASECPILLPADDVRAVAARERTDVMRAVAALARVIARNRPDRTRSTEKMREVVAAIRDAAAVACDDINALTASRSS